MCVPCSLKRHHLSALVSSPLPTHWTAGACCWKWAALLERGWNADATTIEDIWQLKRNAEWGRAGGQQSQSQRLGGTGQSESSLQTVTQMPPVTGSASRHEGNTADQCLQARREALWPKESKQVSRPTPGTAVAVPGKQSSAQNEDEVNSAGHFKAFLRAQQMTERMGWFHLERRNTFRAMSHFQSSFRRMRSIENCFTSLQKYMIKCILWT